MKQTPCYVGIDVSKAQLDVHVKPTSFSSSFPNTSQGHQSLLLFLSSLPLERIVLEASGGYEKPLLTLLEHAALPVVRINPRQIRHFAKAVGLLAKTDTLDASVIAWYAQAIQPPVRAVPSPHQHTLAELMSSRRHLVNTLTAHKNYLKTVSLESVREIFQTLIQTLEYQLADLLNHIQCLINQVPVWQERQALLKSAPGVGQVVSLTLLATLPELGELTDKQLASLVGLAPFNQDSGKHKGKRRIWGGRAEVRTVLYMGVVSAISAKKESRLKTFYTNLVARGKSKKVALVACMRKLITLLNRMVKTGERWQEPCMSS